MAADSRILRPSSLCAFFLFCLQCASAFYIPGYSIKSYADGDTIPLFVNKIYSDNTQVQYAYSQLPWVVPSSGRKRPGTGLVSGANIGLNLGEVLRGDRIVVSDYELEMGKDEEVHYLGAQQVDRAGLRRAIEVVKKGYVAEWIVDNLPGATSFMTVDKSKKYYAAGFKVGYEEPNPLTGQPRYYLNNHVTLVVRYHRAPGRAGEQGKRVIVGFEVYAKSIEASNRDSKGFPADLHDVRNGLELTMAHNITNSSIPHDTSYFPAEIDDAPDDATLTIPYTYSVYFREEEHVEWANRWDLYFVNQEESNTIHWLAIVNSLVICGLLTAVVAVILARTIRGDIKMYKEGGLEEGKLKPGTGSIRRSKGLRSPRKSMEKSGGLLLEPVEKERFSSPDDSDDEITPEDITGWKLVHGDVFRPPSYGQILAPLIGSGTQLVIMSGGLLLLSCLGVLNPSFRGGFVSVGFALFILAGTFSGYFSARVYRTFGGQLWKYNAIVTATLFPGLLFATIFLLNLFVWAQASSTAIPLGTLFALAFLWLLVQLPLVYLGANYGYNSAGAYHHPIKASTVPRPIPHQPWYAKSSVQSALLFGLLPFAVIWIELLFVFRALWADKSGYYYVFGFLAVVASLLVVTIMETTVIAIYLQLCSENHKWWWQGFWVGSGSAAWVFMYCGYYYFVHLHIEGWVSGCLFFAYCALGCAGFGLGAGTVGFLTAYWFVRRIYGAIKVD